MSDTNATLPELNRGHLYEWLTPYQQMQEIVRQREAQLADAMRRLAEVEATNRWIPCSERMPERLETCMCVTSYGAALAATQVFLHGMWVDSTNRHAPAYMPEEISFWRPMPDAPAPTTDSTPGGERGEGMKEFNALDYDCPVCSAKIGTYCDPDFLLGLPFAPMIGFTHPQRTEYNLLANQPADGTPASKVAFDNAVLRDGRI